MRRRKIDETTTWNIIVEGRYMYNLSDGKLDTKPYSIEATLNKEHVEKGPLSSFVKYIAPVVMPKKYPDYISLHTHTIVKMTCSNPDLVGDNLAVMSWHQLKDYVEYIGLEVDVDLYADTGTLRQAIEECEDDETAFLKSQEKLAERIGPEIKLKRDAEKLNSQGVSSPETAPEIQEVAVGRSIPKVKRLNASKDIEEIEKDTGVPLEV